MDDVIDYLGVKFEGLARRQSYQLIPPFAGMTEGLGECEELG